MGTSDRLDGFQRRHRFVGIPIAVTYKFFDDQGNYLAAIITYYAFVAIFPLLLIASSVLGFVLQGDTELQNDILNTTLAQFPIIGDQLTRPEGLRGSGLAVVLGAVAALYGALGLGQASQNAMNIAWAVPRNSRPNPFLGRLRSLFLLVLAGFSVLAVTLVSVIGSSTEVFGTRVDTTLRVFITLATVALITLAFTSLFRLAAARRHSWSHAFPGALAVALMWQILQLAGSAYARHVIGKANSVNGTFAFVLGIIAVIYVATVMVIIGIEINVVLGKKLYPRALLTPFTDNVELTDADRRAYSDYAKAQRHKGFESIKITFNPTTNGLPAPETPAAPATPEKAAPDHEDTTR